jgi:Arc/MetJ-type ribon-helix-helix transcriptional regulator
MNTNASTDIKLLIKRKIFKTEDEAIRNLLREYILKQIADLRREIGRFERKYGMRFEQFSDYIHDRSVLLEKGDLSAEQRLNLNQEIMRDEDTWLDWKAAQEMLDSWLGISKEIAA